MNPAEKYGTYISNWPTGLYFYKKMGLAGKTLTGYLIKSSSDMALFRDAPDSELTYYPEWSPANGWCTHVTGWTRVGDL